MKKTAHYEAFLKLETGAHTARVSQLLATPDGKSLITAGGDKTIRVWDIESKTQTRMLLGEIGPGSHGSLQAMALSPNGKYLASLAWMYPDGNYDAQFRQTDVRFFEVETGNLHAGFRFPGTLQDLDFSRDGKYLVIVGNPNETRRGMVMVYEAKAVLSRFGKKPAPVASAILYENDLIPSYVRFVPEKAGKDGSYRIVAASWEHWRPNAPEYTGRLFSFSLSSAKKLTRLFEKELDDQIAPDSLAVSKGFTVITAAALSEEKNKKFYCYDHDGQLVNAVDSETVPAPPAFSPDENQLIVGQREDKALIQVKVYDVAYGRFPLKSVYFGHDSETWGVALLKDGMAFSAGGDQNAIHFWETKHMEGKFVAEIKGVGRVVHVVGVSPEDQIGFGMRDDLRLKNGNIVLQRVFDLRTMSLKSFPFQQAIDFRRAQKTFGEKRLDFSDQFNWNLGLLPDMALFPLPTGEWYNVSTYGFTERGSVVAGSPDGKVRVAPRQPEGYYQMSGRALVGHEAAVLDHASGGRWLVTTGADQVLRLWFADDVEDDTGEHLYPALNLFVGSDDEWVIWSKSGYYNASQNGDQRFGYHINRGAEMEALYFPSDRFIKTYFRPDVIQAIFEHGSETRALDALGQQGQTREAINVETILPPIVELAPNGIVVEPKKVTFKFSVQALNPGAPATRVWVIRNDQFAWEGKPKKGTYKVTLPLEPGRNQFKIFAETKSSKSVPLVHDVMGPPTKVGKSKASGPLEGMGVARGAKAAESARSQANALLGVQENGTLYILSVGVSTLKNETDDFKSLTFADDDAISVYNAFGRSKLTGKLDKKGALKNKAFESVEATILLNEQATKAAILKAVDKICEKIRKRNAAGKQQRDVFLLFLSGHGVRRSDDFERELYFWCYDLMKSSTRATGLSFIELGEKITSLPADVILATDACHSGMAGSDAVRGLDPNELAKRIYAINERGLYILNASRSEEFAREHETIGHGVFTKAILEALEFETDMSMMNLMASVQRRVLYYTNHLQTPVFRLYGDLLPLTVYGK
jgi:WD40 repeat protein